jgi:uncharacterized membrane protein YeiH
VVAQTRRMDLLQITTWIAVFVAALSGALAGRQCGMDYFGTYVLALITATGGGALRNMIIGVFPVPPFSDPALLAIPAVGALVAWFGARWWDRVKRIISIVDAVAIGVFVGIGIRIGQQHGHAWWVCLCLGVITAAFGGVLRDVIRNEVPLIFRKEIYATACLIGGGLLLILDHFGVPGGIGIAITTVVVTGIRLLAIRYAINHSED